MRELNPKISTWMEAFVRRAMAIRPEDRYQSVGEMQRELQARLFKVRQRRAAPHRISPTEKQAKVPPQTEFEQGRPGQTSHRQSSQPSGLSPLAQMAIPVITILSAVGLVALISVVASSPGGILIICGAIILSGLIYDHLFGGRQRHPPRF